MKTPTTVNELLDYWPGHIPFKGRLVSKDGSCMCAQAQVLHFLGGLTIDELRATNQKDADLQVAQLLNISLAHSVLLRIINDKLKGAPSCVLRHPEQVLGEQAPTILAFWRHLDRTTPRALEMTHEWVGVNVELRSQKAANEAARAMVGRNTQEAAKDAAQSALYRNAESWKASWAAAAATNEIQGARYISADNQPFLFLPLFGFSDPMSVMASAV